MPLPYARGSEGANVRGYSPQEVAIPQRLRAHNLGIRTDWSPFDAARVRRPSGSAVPLGAGVRQPGQPGDRGPAADAAAAGAQAWAADAADRGGFAGGLRGAELGAGTG